MATTGSIFDALLGRFYADDVELELGAGVNTKDGVTAARNEATRRIDLTADAPYVYRKGYRWAGASTVVATGAGTVALALDSTATTIAVGSVVSDGDGAELTARVWLSKSDGTVVYRDEIAFALYREVASAELHLLDLAQNGADQIGTGTQTLVIAGANSAVSYTITAAHGGTLAIAVAQDGAIARNARATLWLGDAWTVPTS